MVVIVDDTLELENLTDDQDCIDQGAENASMINEVKQNRRLRDVRVRQVRDVDQEAVRAVVDTLRATSGARDHVTDDKAETGEHIHHQHDCRLMKNKKI